MVMPSPYCEEDPPLIRTVTLHALRDQIMVGNLLTTPLEFGTIFRKITWESLDQNGYGLASNGA